MLTWLKNFWELLKETAIEFDEDHATKLSASLAYYTLFSIGPLMLIVITLLGKFYRKADVTQQVFDQVSGYIGVDAAKQLQSTLDNMAKQESTTLFGIIGGVVFLFGATSIFTEIQSSLNYMWSIKAKPKRGWLKFITDRLISFVLIIGLGILMIATLTVNVVIDLASNSLHRFVGNANVVLVKGANIGVLLLITTVFFIVIFKVLPDAKLHWKDTIVGAAFTGFLFLIGKFLITWYLTSSSIIDAYGAAASLIILLSWIYYSALILYFGAEFTEVYARKWGYGLTVKSTAVFIIKREATELKKLKHPIQDN